MYIYVIVCTGLCGIRKTIRNNLKVNLILLMLSMGRGRRYSELCFELASSLLKIFIERDNEFLVTSQTFAIARIGKRTEVGARHSIWSSHMRHSD